VEPSAEETGVRRELMALYAKLGRREEARELEDVERSMALLRTWYAERVPLDLARAYGELGLLEDAERLALEAVEADPEGLTVSACSALCSLAREHGDEARRRAWAARWAAHLDGRVADEPYDVGHRLARARVRLEELGDLEGAREDVEQVLAWDPEAAEARRLAAWIALESGDAQGALEGFRAAEPLAWATGRNGPGERGEVGLALARAAVEGSAAAREALQRALWRWPTGRYKERLEELLQ
jgi:tetratricopeptide (TPR) repeat protein